MPSNNAAHFTPEQRTREVARLLAAGVRRLFSRPAAAPPGPPIPREKAQESSETGLEDGREVRLSVHTG
jgi:hypothetical protein